MVYRGGSSCRRPVSGTFRTLRGVRHHAVATSTLGAIERLIGKLEQGRGIIGSTEACDTDRYGERHAAGTALEGKRLARHSSPQPFRHNGPNRKIGFRHHDDEFLAAVAAGQVDAADRLAYPERKLAQHLIASIVAMRVVDRLEIINVQDQQSQWR